MLLQVLGPAPIRPTKLLAELLVEHAPKYGELDRQAKALVETAGKIPAPLAGNDASTVVRDALTDGTADELDLVQMFGRTANAVIEWNATREALTNLLSALHNEKDLALTAAIPAMYGDLDTRVRATIDQLRSSPITKARATSAEEAFAADLTREDWVDYLQLRTTYAEIYSVLLKLVNTAEGDTHAYNGEHWGVSRLANVQQVWPEFAPVLAKVSNARPPWQPDRTRSAQDIDTFLDWLIRTPAATPAASSPDQLATRKAALRPALQRAHAEYDDAYRRNPSNPQPQQPAAPVPTPLTREEPLGCRPQPNTQPPPRR